MFRGGSREKGADISLKLIATHLLLECISCIRAVSKCTSGDIVHNIPNMKRCRQFWETEHSSLLNPARLVWPTGQAIRPGNIPYCTSNPQKPVLRPHSCVLTIKLNIPNILTYFFFVLVWKSALWTLWEMLNVDDDLMKPHSWKTNCILGLL